MSVNVPTNTKVKEQDINNKLRLYGIYEAFANGKVPSNKQIDVALNSALASKALSSPSKDLSEEGRKLVADLREVIEQSKLLLLSKNEGNLIQDFIWKCQQLTGGDAKLPGAPVDKDTAKQHGNQAVDGLRTLGTLLLSNGQFRKLLSDFTVLIRDMAGDAAQTAATKINPSDDQLAQIDRPAEDNTWHEVPSVAELKGKANDLYQKNKPIGKKDVDAAADRVAASDNPDAAAQIESDRLRAQASANIPDETKQTARETKETARLKAKNYFNQKMPQERRDQTIWRLKKMIVEIQGHEDYSNAIETLLTLAETYASHGKDVGQQGVGTVKGWYSQNEGMLTSLKTLIERFANSTSSEDLFDAIRVVYQDAQKDPELKQWFKDIDAYIRKCLQQQGYVIQDASTEEGRALYDRGRFLLRERYRDHTNHVLDEAKFLGTQFDQDPQNKAFAASMEKLFNHLGNDENGKPVFKKHLVKDLTTVIVPGFFETVRYVPVPRIEYSDPQVDVVVENLVIESDNLFPNSLEIASDNHFKWGRKKIANYNKNKVMVAASGVQMDLRDVSYYLKRKQGFPSVTDKGIMDLFLGGDGFSFKLALETADKSDRAHFFKVTSVSVDIKNLKIKLKKSNHKLLFNIFKPTLMNIVKPVLTKVIEKEIRAAFAKGDSFFYEVDKQAKLALEEVREDPENAPNIYSRYATAFQQELAKGKKKAEKAKKVADNTKVNVAITHDESIFKDIKLPGGISTKATEYKQEAAKGDRWESPVFGLGSAKESTSIPKVPEVTRKAHTSTAPVLRDGVSNGGPTNGATKIATNGGAPAVLGTPAALGTTI